MLQQTSVLSVLAAALTLHAGFNVAAESTSAPQVQEQEQQRVFGSELMTDQERSEYRDRMRAATTAEERERLRIEHHERMKTRAAERGITLPDMPPAPGPGGGMVPGAGRGMGQGVGQAARARAGQVTPGGRNVPGFSEFDTDGDGVVGQAEFDAARSQRIAGRASEGRAMRGLADAESFHDIDADRDGAISSEEFSAHQQRRASEGNARDVRRGGGVGMGGMEPGSGMRQGGGR